MNILSLLKAHTPLQLLFVDPAVLKGGFRKHRVFPAASISVAPIDPPVGFLLSPPQGNPPLQAPGAAFSHE